MVKGKNIRTTRFYTSVCVAFFTRRIDYTGWETTLGPPPKPQIQTSQEIHIYSIKISSMSDSRAKFHEPELIFNP